MDVVKLKNGSEEAEPLVRSVMLSLQTLWDGGLPGVLALCDLKKLCAEPGSSVSMIGKLQDLSLVQPDHKVHDSIRNVVMSACQGDGLGMTLTSPLAD